MHRRVNRSARRSRAALPWFCLFVACLSHAVGADRDILRLAGRTTRRIDLRGRTATPGLIDSHAHIAEAGVGELFHQAGVHVGTHAIGDRAIDWVVDTDAQVLAETPTHGLRHSIIHANVPSDHALSVMALLETKYDAGYPEAQAPFLWWIGEGPAVRNDAAAWRCRLRRHETVKPKCYPLRISP